MDPTALREFDAGFVKSDTLSGYPYMLIEQKRAGLPFVQLAAPYD